MKFTSTRHSEKISRLLYRSGKALDLFYSRSTSGAGWVSFIEKAYAVFLSKRKGTTLSYDSLKRVDCKTVIQDLMGPRKPPLVLGTKKNILYLKRVLSEATVYPTVATTPKGRAFNTPHGAVSNHAYAVLGLTKKIIKGRTKVFVKLTSQFAESGPEELPLEHFLKDFDEVITLQRESG